MYTPRRIYLSRDMLTRPRRGEDAELLAGSAVEEGEVRDVDAAAAEHEARRRAERVRPGAAVLGDDLPGPVEDGDLVGLVRADVEVSAHVEGDAVSPVERSTGDALREE